MNGRCIVTRETPLNKEGIKLAELGVGDTFGEEALIAEAKRNATVTMMTDGVLMRLNKQDFRELMNEPLLQWVNFEQAREIIAQGGKWLDVRLPSEHANLAIDDSLNIPLYFIRLKISTLDRNVPYVVYCDTGRRSSAAAFILVERGLMLMCSLGGLPVGTWRFGGRLRVESGAFLARSCRSLFLAARRLRGFFIRSRNHSIAVRLGVGACVRGRRRARSRGLLGTGPKNSPSPPSIRRGLPVKHPCFTSSLPTPENAHVTDPREAPRL